MKNDEQDARIQKKKRIKIKTKIIEFLIMIGTPYDFLSSSFIVVFLFNFVEAIV